jgi:hypothetical protein
LDREIYERDSIYNKSRQIDVKILGIKHFIKNLFISYLSKSLLHILPDNNRKTIVI